MVTDFHVARKRKSKRARLREDEDGSPPTKRARVEMKSSNGVVCESLSEVNDAILKKKKFTIAPSVTTLSMQITILCSEAYRGW